jgi:hypothetical protein
MSMAEIARYLRINRGVTSNNQSRYDYSLPVKHASLHYHPWEHMKSKEDLLSLRQQRGQKIHHTRRSNFFLI